MLRPMLRVREEEWMDREGVDPAELKRALAYIRGVNRWLGYNRATGRRLQELLGGRWGSGGGEVGGEGGGVLDVATGSGDLPAALMGEWGEWGEGAEGGGVGGWWGVDLHLVTIEEAKARVPGLRCVRGDALGLPFEEGVFDVVMTSMFLHHLSEAMAVGVMREMWRVVRPGGVVLAADLLRNRRALFWIKLLTIGTGAMIRHDAVASVRQAFTVEEVEAMAAEAGWEGAEVRRHFGHRFTVAARKG